MDIKRGWIYLADLSPRRGAEPGKTRPVLVLQTDLLNKVGHPSSIVIPLTTNVVNDAEPLRVRIKADHAGFSKESDLMMDQIRAIDNRRLFKQGTNVPIKRITVLEKELLQRVETCLRQILEL